MFIAKKYSTFNEFIFFSEYSVLLNIFQQDECFCSKLGMEVEYMLNVQSKNITFSELGDLPVALFCQSRALLVWTFDSRFYDLSSILVIARGTFCPSVRHFIDIAALHPGQRCQPLKAKISNQNAQNS